MKEDKKDSRLSIQSSSQSTLTEQTFQGPVTTGGQYWTVSEGVAIRTGFSCRECKKVIQQGELVTVRDGRKMRFFYHRKCYAGVSDPRSQPSSSFNNPLFKKSIHTEAPVVKGRGKWSVAKYGYDDTHI